MYFYRVRYGKLYKPGKNTRPHDRANGSRERYRTYPARRAPPRATRLMTHGESMKEIRICTADLRDFCIVYSGKDTESVEHAARELARYLAAASGVELDVIEANAVPSGRAVISVGPAVNAGVYAPQCEDDYFYSIAPGRVCITGGAPRGTLYGVYAFLEDEIGWRFFTADCEVLQNDGRTLSLAPKEVTWVPKIEWRDVCAAVYRAPDIAAKRRLNSGYDRRFEAKHGGCFEYPGRFVHTMESLLDVPQHQQPCFSDPKNLKKCIEEVRKILRAYPYARILSVSQNDSEEGEITYCTCKKCAKIDEEEGSHAGSMLRFVNAVADAIKDEFPHVKIMTLAYLHTLDCPKITRPADNVIIEFSPMTMNFAHTVQEPQNASFLKAFADWTAVAKNIYIWDYVVNFSFSVPTFPNFHTLRRDVKFYAEHHVNGFFFEADNYYEDGHTTDLSELRAYLLSKLMCNPSMTEVEYRRHRSEFLTAYYGPGAEFIDRYIDEICELATYPDHFVGCFENPNTMYVGPEYLSRLPNMEQWWNLAQHAAATPEQKDRVARARLGYTYHKLLFAFDLLANLAQTRDDILMENRLFYEGVKKYGIQPRGMGSTLPEITDFEKNTAVGIYW